MTATVTRQFIPAAVAVLCVVWLAFYVPVVFITTAVHVSTAMTTAKAVGLWVMWTCLTVSVFNLKASVIWCRAWGRMPAAQAAEPVTTLPVQPERWPTHNRQRRVRAVGVAFTVLVLLIIGSTAGTANTADVPIIIVVSSTDAPPTPAFAIAVTTVIAVFAGLLLYRLWVRTHVQETTKETALLRTPVIRRCHSCGAILPEHSTRRRQWCTDACRMRNYRQRKRYSTREASLTICPLSDQMGSKDNDTGDTRT